MKEKEQHEFEITRGMYVTVRLLALALCLLMLFFIGRGAIHFCLGLFADGDHLVKLPGQESPLISLEDLDAKPKPVYIDPSQRVEIARADFTVAGDMMPHLPIVRSSAIADGYVFDDIFAYVKPYLAAADYAAANLETTLSGTDGKEYTGFPNFNSPDQFALSAQSAGFDLLLTGNEHCYDYGTAGLQRTLSTLKDYRLDTLGTVESSGETRHLIKNINGIKVGMACYTFADMDENGNVKSWRAFVKSGGTSALVYTNGISKEEEEELHKQLCDLRDDGVWGIGDVFTKEEAAVYHIGGDFTFVLETNGHTSFSSDWQRPFMKQLGSGDYRYGKATHGHLPQKGPTPTLVAFGPDMKEGAVLANAELVDEAPTFAHCLGIEMKNTDGRVLTELFK